MVHLCPFERLESELLECIPVQFIHNTGFDNSLNVGYPIETGVEFIIGEHSRVSLYIR